MLALCGAFAAVVLSYCRPHEPSTPEEIVRLWQSYIDRNQFDSARLYSTELARSYIDFLDALTQGDSSDIFETSLYRLRCEVQGDSAICHYLIEGELGEKIPDTLVLHLVQGRWMVHRVEGFLVIPVDTFLPDDAHRLFPDDSLDAGQE